MSDRATITITLTPEQIADAIGMYIRARVLKEQSGKFSTAPILTHNAPAYVADKVTATYHGHTVWVTPDEEKGK